jgi:uncharacterized protein YjbJ (UPF0337 family)
MSTSDSTVKGKFDEISGKVKQGIGEAVGNDNLANKGAAEQVKGHAEQAWGSVKEGVHDTAADYKARKQPQAESDAHDVREKITSTAQNVKERIQAGVQHMKEDHKKTA